MRFTRVSIALATLLLAAQSVPAQFTQNNRLTDLADRLSRDADAFADATYNSYTNSFRSSRTDIEAVMVAQQFAASARIFYRMVVDRRRNQDLRDAFSVLQESARSVDRNNQQQRTAWSNVQRTMNDLSRELNLDSSDGGGGGGGGNQGDNRS